MIKKKILHFFCDLIPNKNRKQMTLPTKVLLFYLYLYLYFILFQVIKPHFHIQWGEKKKIKAEHIENGEECNESVTMIHRESLIVTYWTGNFYFEKQYLFKKHYC